jgi:FkbM family methyltransferase
MKIQAILVMKNDFTKLDFTLSNFCKHNPDIPVLVLNAGGESPEQITKKYHSVNLKHCEDLWAKPSFGPKFADYFFEYGLNENFTHTILLETDVLTNQKITKLPLYDISGCLNYGGSHQIYEFLGIKDDHFHTGCGGTIFSLNYFKKIKENNYNIFQTVYEKYPNEYFMDLMLTLAARVNGLTFGDWEEVSNVTGHLKKINDTYQLASCNYSATMVHHYKVNDFKKVFFDCGTHIGEGLEHFVKILNFDQNWIVYTFEANPHTYDQFKNTKKDFIEKYNIQHHNKAVYTYDGEIEINEETPPNEENIGAGSSVLSLDEWNPQDATVKGWFKTKSKVSCFDFSKILKKFQGFDVYVKMDIEGAEYDILEHLIETNTLSIIKYLFVEFHSNYFFDKEKAKQRENNILNKIKEQKINFYEWH